MIGAVKNLTGGSNMGFASISVTYPEGSVCTCTNGTKTYTAKTTVGVYLFNVNAAGNWVISCTDGTNTDTVSVTVSTEGETLSATLTYFRAYIKVTATQSSTITCTNGTTTYETPAAVTSYTFTVREVGAWTIKGTYSGRSESKTTSISTEGQSATVELVYEFIAFADGAYKDISAMKGMSLSGGNLVLTAYAGYNSSRDVFAGVGASSDIAINVKDYKTLRVNLRWVNNNKYNATYRKGGVGLTSSSYAGSTSMSDSSSSSFAVVKVLSNGGYGSALDAVYDIDVKSLTGNYYITAYTCSWADSDEGYSTSTTLYLRDIRLIP